MTTTRPTYLFQLTQAAQDLRALARLTDDDDVAAWVEIALADYADLREAIKYDGPDSVTPADVAGFLADHKPLFDRAARAIADDVRSRDH